VQTLQVGFQVSERRACAVVGMQRSTYRYRSSAKDQTALRMRLRDRAAARVRYGYRRLHVLLQREGWRVNHKRVYRLYRLEGLGLRLKRTRKRVSAVRVVPPRAQKPNERWRMDFMTDSLYDGRRFRLLTIVDTVTRESPAIVVDRSLTGQRVVAALEQLQATRGLPQRIAVDNWPRVYLESVGCVGTPHGVQLEFSRPGTPTDTACSEAFNGRLRQACLDQHWFTSIDDARTIIEAWREEDNAERPHGALGNLTPQAFAAQWRAQATAPIREELTARLEAVGSTRNAFF
jgi:putative transposase